MSVRRGQFRGFTGVRRHLAGGLLLVVTALSVMMLLAPRVGAAPAGPTPAPSPSAFPKYEPGLLPSRSVSGLLPRETAPGLLPPGTTPTDKVGGRAEAGDSKKDTGKGGADKPKELSAKEKKAAEQEKLRREMRKRVEEYKARHGDGGVLNAFEVTDKKGLPVSSYRIVSDNGGITDIPGQFQGLATQGLFEMTKWAIAFGCWLISWALSWSLASLFVKPAMHLSDALYSQTIVQLGVPGLLMAYSGVVAFWNITFGNRSRGWGEIAASTVIGALAVSAFAAPPQMLLGQQDGAVGKARDLGIAVYAITTGHEDSLTKAGQITEDKARELTRTVTDGIVEAFVARPSFLLSYNQQLSKKCVGLYSDSRVQTAFFNDMVDSVKKRMNTSATALDSGIVGDIKAAIADKAFDYVANDMLGLNPQEDFEKACVTDAGAAKKAGWDKVGGALFIFIAALLMTALLLVTAFFYLSTQMRLVIEAVLARVALVAGIMPGPGRAWLWERAANIVRLLGLLVGLVVGLAIAVTLVTAMLNADFGDNAGALPARFVAVDAMVIACFMFRKRLTLKSKAWAASARTRLGNSPLGGRAPAVMNQDAGRKRSLARTLATTAFMVGAIAATGGAAAAGGAAAGTGSLMSLGGRGSTALAGRLGTRMAVRGTAALANGATKAVAGTAKAAYGAGKFGLKYSVGAPVYLPQAARAASTAVKAAPGNLARSAAQLRSRITQPVTRQLPAVRDFSQTYWNNIGGRWAGNRIRMHRGLPPRPHPRTPPLPVNRPAVPPPAMRRPAAGPAPVPTRPRPARRAARPAQQPAASSQQQALRQRLYRMSTDAARAHRPAPSPEPQPSPAPAAPRPRTARPAPHRRTR